MRTGGLKIQKKNCGRPLCEIPSQAEKLPDDLPPGLPATVSLGVQFYLEIMLLLYHLKKI